VFEHLQRITKEITLDTHSNHYIKNFCHSEQHFLSTNCASNHVLIHGRPGAISSMVEHYKECKALSPMDTSACIFLPDRKDYRNLADGMHLVHRYKKGEWIYKTGSNSENYLRYDMCVYYDPPAASVAAVGSGLIFKGQLGGYPCRVLFDTGADVSIVSEYWARRAYFTLNADDTHLVMADGTQVKTHGSIRSKLRVSSYIGDVRLRVMPLQPSIDVILGMDDNSTAPPSPLPTCRLPSAARPKVWCSPERVPKVPVENKC